MFMSLSHSDTILSYSELLLYVTHLRQGEV